MTLAPPHEKCFPAVAGMVSFEAACHEAVKLARPIDRQEEISVASAMGRVLAVPIKAPHALPRFDQAAMDGYAICIGGDGSPSILPITGITKAGNAPGLLLQGTAHRIMTGAALPLGADTVVIQEDVTRRDDVVQFRSGIRPGGHIRRAGEDVSEGDTVLEAGRVIGWPEIALLAALGITTVRAIRTLRTAVLTTGSELRAAHEPLTPGAIRDANGPMLAALLEHPNTSVSLQSVPDDPALITKALTALSQEADLVITTAGMSAGEEDHVCDAVAGAGGRLDIVRVAVKPGKPVGFGKVGDACFIGLPGNPQAAAFGALAFIRPMIRAFLGQTESRPVIADMAFAFGHKPGRTELLPVRLANRNGRLIADRAGPEGSHRMMTLVSADAVAIVPETCASVEVGTSVKILPFDPMRFQQ